MTNQIKNFIEEGEKELKQEWLETADMANDFTTYVKMSGSYVLNPEEISKWWLDKFSSRQISLIKMIVEDTILELGKINFLEDIKGEENRKLTLERYRKFKDTISSKLKDLYK